LGLGIATLEIKPRDQTKSGSLLKPWSFPNIRVCKSRIANTAHTLQAGQPLFSTWGMTMISIGESLMTGESFDHVVRIDRSVNQTFANAHERSDPQPVFSFMLHWMACCISSRAVRKDSFSLMCA
jgi:hypothetical protein